MNTYSTSMPPRRACRLETVAEEQCNGTSRPSPHWLPRFASIALLAATLAASLNLARAENWPCWRGPRGDGTSRELSAPIHWAGSSNFVWRTVLPGLGHSSPIVWGERIFTVTALTETQERLLLCLDRKSGGI